MFQLFLQMILKALLFTISMQLLFSQTEAQIVNSYPELNITSGTDDYILQNQRKYNNNIVDMEMQLVTYQAQYRGELRVINTQTDLLTKKLLDIEKELILLEVLNVLSKYCVQKYRSQIPTAEMVRTQIGVCVTSAANNYTNLIKLPSSTITQLKAHYNTNFKTSLNGCKSKYNAYDNYTSCVVNKIESANIHTVTQQKMFNTQYQDAKNAGEKYVRLAVECSYNIVFRTDTVVGQTVYSIDQCIDGKDFPAPCVSTDTCPVEFKVYLTQESFLNETLVNPFYGINDTMTCVQVKYINATQFN